MAIGFRTSGRIALDYMESVASDDAERPARLAMARDVFNKSRAYSLVNKPAGLLGVVFSVLVLTWPVLVLLDLFAGLETAASAMIQTTLAALAGLSFLLHVTYKAKQTAMENTLRLIAYSRMGNDEVLQELQKLGDIDIGLPAREIGEIDHAPAARDRPPG